MSQFNDIQAKKFALILYVALIKRLYLDCRGTQVLISLGEKLTATGKSVMLAIPRYWNKGASKYFASPYDTVMAVVRSDTARVTGDVATPGALVKIEPTEEGSEYRMFVDMDRPTLKEFGPHCHAPLMLTQKWLSRLHSGEIVPTERELEWAEAQIGKDRFRKTEQDEPENKGKGRKKKETEPVENVDIFGDDPAPTETPAPPAETPAPSVAADDATGRIDMLESKLDMLIDKLTK